jgi:hypothetical protein
MIAMLFHIPNISNLGLGIPMSLLGALSLINAIIQKSRARKNQKSHLESDIAARFNIPIAGLLLWFILSIGIIFQWTISLYGLVVVVILLLGSASQNAWALLVEIKR